MTLVEWTAALVRCPSVTPDDCGALDLVAARAATLGFEIHRLPFGEGAGRIDNLVAHRRGLAPGSFGFAGHSDVVPPGDPATWTSPPFAAAVADGRLVGRGAVDMKGAIAAFMAAAERHLARRDSSLTLIITGDEEGEATEGTVRLMPWLAAHDLVPEAVLVGEPTSATSLGDTIKVGRRGSVNIGVTVRGVQGHVAYPARADNPIPRLVAILSALAARQLDPGSAWFEPSNLEVTRIAGGEPSATNVIPAVASARINIRFNDCHRGDDLVAWVAEVARAHGGEIEARISGEAFLTGPGRLPDTVAAAVEAVTGIAPARTTGGGTSDARFIRAHCPVVELGLVGTTMHRIDEAVPIEDLHRLADIYTEVLDRWFG